MSVAWAGAPATLPSVHTIRIPCQSSAGSLLWRAEVESRSSATAGCGAGREPKRLGIVIYESWSTRRIATEESVTDLARCL
jgi:hypothetical protein